MCGPGARAAGTERRESRAIIAFQVSREVLWAATFILGTFIGSFLNVCIHRLPRDLSIVRPRSRCPHCEHPIAWYDNVPLLSYAMLAGRCRSCRELIAWRYPLVEALTGFTAVVVFARFGFGPAGGIYFAFLASLIAVSFIDFDFQIIPDEISLGGLAVGIALSAFLPQLHGTPSRELAVGRAVIGAITGGGLLLATGAAGDVMLLGLRRLGVMLRKHPNWRRRLARYRHMQESMGGGDIKLMAMAGAVLGWKLAALTFFLAPVLAVGPGLIMVLCRKSHVIPYGPFLSLGLVVSLFFGERILEVMGVDLTIRLLWEYYQGR